MPDRPVKLNVKVVPGASRSEICGWLGDALKIRVAAPPERGKANAAIEGLICAKLDLPKSAVRIISGGTSSRKIVDIFGQPQAEVFKLLGKPAR